MENLVHDLPLPIDFEQREQVCEPVAGPFIEFKPHGATWVTDVRFWHLADILCTRPDVRFRG